MVSMQGPIGDRHVPVHLSVWPDRSSGASPIGRVDTTVEHPQREASSRIDMIHFMAASYRLGGGRYTRIGKLAERAEGIGAAIYASPLSNSAFTVAMFRAFSFFTSLIAQEGRGARSRPSGVPINAAGIRSPIASRINFRLGRK